MTNETKVKDDGTVSRPQTAPGIEKDDVKKKKKKERCRGVLRRLDR